MPLKTKISHLQAILTKPRRFAIPTMHTLVKKTESAAHSTYLLFEVIEGHGALSVCAGILLATFILSVFTEVSHS